MVERTPREQPIERPVPPPVERPVQPPRREPISPIEERPVPTPRPIEKPPIFAPRPAENAQLIEIMQYQFAVYDLALYLDTHPNDMRAHEARKKYATRLHELVMAYEEAHGPMSLLSPHGDYRKYVNEPWPWEICF